jgi:hypothetical protein
MPKGAAFSGLSAAWLHGLDVDPGEAIEITVPAEARVSVRVGLQVHRRALADGEVVTTRGMPATSMPRTLRDLCLGKTLMECVVLVDMALHARLVSLEMLQTSVMELAGKQGVYGLRRAIEHGEPKAASPMETRLRMTVVLARLPRPQAQVAIYDRDRGFCGRVDLYYPNERLALEYDGATHDGSLAEDNRRQNRLIGAGVTLLRFTAGDIYRTPDVVARQVREALGRLRAHR